MDTFVEVGAAALEAIFAAAPVGLVVYDASGAIIRANPAGQRLLGYSESEMQLPLCVRTAQGQAWTTDGRHLAQHELPVMRALSGDSFQNMVIWSLDKAGEKRLLSMGGAPIRRNGVVAGAILTVQDLTEVENLRRCEACLREIAEQKAAEWDALFQSLPDAASVFDESGEIIEANRAWLDLMGVRSLNELQTTKMPHHAPPEMFRHADGSVMSLDDRPAMRLMRGEVIDNLPCCVMHPTRGRMDLLLSGGPIRVLPGHPRRFLRISRDVSALRRLEQARQQFFQVVAHELRNPLQVIKGVVQVLRQRLKRSDTDQHEKYLKSLESQVSHMTDLIADLITAVKIGEPTITLSLTETDLADVLNAALEPYLLGDTGRCIEVDLRSAVGVRLSVDQLRLTEVVTNLMNNSVKYTQPGGHIWVGVTLADGAALVRIEDDGIGIAEDELQRVFDGLYRSRRLSEWGRSGLGLGLYISREIARKHGGNLWAELRRGGGTVMVLRLPLAGPGGGGE